MSGRFDNWTEEHTEVFGKKWFMKFNDFCEFLAFVRRVLSVLYVPQKSLLFQNLIAHVYKRYSTFQNNIFRISNDGPEPRGYFVCVSDPLFTCHYITIFEILSPLGGNLRTELKVDLIKSISAIASITPNGIEPNLVDDKLEIIDKTAFEEKYGLVWKTL